MPIGKNVNRCPLSKHASLPLTLDFKVNELKIVCSVLPVRDGSMFAIGHLISSDDLKIEED
jgi:hypothetical protein